jgi:glucuronosyltransferase
LHKIGKVDCRYKQNSERASKEFKDRPLSPLDTAVFWVEYVIRHNGAPQLRIVGADLPWYQYYLVDVAIILFISFFAFLTVLVFVTKFIIRFIYGGRKEKHD